MMVDYLALWRAMLIIGVFSYALWKESPYFRFCEHAFLGSALGYTLVITIKTINTTAVFPLVSEAKIIYVIPIILGIVLFLRYSNSTKWISRWPIALIIGVGTALGMRGVLYAYIISQVKATATASFMTDNALTNFNNIISVLTTILVLLFFTFTVLKGEKEGSLMFQLRKISRLMIMLTLGAFFGSITMARLTLIAGQIKELLIAFGLLTS